MAKIMPSKKTGKDDDTIPRNCRPMSLFTTPGKVMKAVIATRITYFKEVYRLLLDNHCGARKHKSTVHVISHLEEVILMDREGRRSPLQCQTCRKGHHQP